MTQSTNPSTQPETDFPPKMGAPAYRALFGAGYTHLEQLTRVREAELKKLHGVGPKAINMLRLALAERGLSFADPEQKP